MLLEAEIIDSVFYVCHRDYIYIYLYLNLHLDLCLIPSRVVTTSQFERKSWPFTKSASITTRTCLVGHGKLGSTR